MIYTLHGPLPSSYVSRKHPRDSTNHEILGVQQVKPAELAQMATLDINNSWGVLQAIVDVLRGFPREEKTSKYLILKDPNKVGSDDYWASESEPTSCTAGISLHVYTCCLLPNTKYLSDQVSCTNIYCDALHTVHTTVQYCW